MHMFNKFEGNEMSTDPIPAQLICVASRCSETTGDNEKETVKYITEYFFGGFTETLAFNTM